MIAFPNGKINLGLHILGKRLDGYHELETVFYPVPISDSLEIIKNPHPARAETIGLSLSGIRLDAPVDENLCVKAFQLLLHDFPHLVPPLLHLHKAIPVGAGLGGGSANGAFTLDLLNQVFTLNRTREQLFAYALKLGSDCPFFLYNKPCFARGRGEVLEPLELDLSGYSLLLVHPPVHISTAWAFKALAESSIRNDASTPRQSLASLMREPPASWKHNLVNDFEALVETAHPRIRQVKETLYREGALYASLSGSGSTIYGIFPKGRLPQAPYGMAAYPIY